MATWKAVNQAVAGAKGIAWDGCHKIYVLLDDAQVTQMRSLGYGDLGDGDGSQLIALNCAADREAAKHTIRDWFEDSCALRFISAVRTVDGDSDANSGFLDLIAQFDDVI